MYITIGRGFIFLGCGPDSDTGLVVVGVSVVVVFNVVVLNIRLG